MKKINAPEVGQARCCKLCADFSGAETHKMNLTKGWVHFTTQDLIKPAWMLVCSMSSTSYFTQDLSSYQDDSPYQIYYRVSANLQYPPLHFKLYPIAATASRFHVIAEIDNFMPGFPGIRHLMAPLEPMCCGAAGVCESDHLSPR